MPHVLIVPIVSRRTGMAFGNVRTSVTSVACPGQPSHGRESYRSPTKANRSVSTNQHVRVAVKSFQMWLSEGPAQDQRQIEDIAPVELDRILVDYFGTIKKQFGGDYTPSSLWALRSYLELHLKDKHYPESITRSTTFERSRVAFKSRRLALCRNQSAS